MILLGYDIGSSFIKVALVNSLTKQTIGVEKYPEKEMEIIAQYPDWAEQNPEYWWECVVASTKKLLNKTHVNPNEIAGIGISYQMHGLVLLDKDQQILRPSIIWCDSRAVEIGNQAFTELGKEKCLSHLLNSPGNFTASKLKWVQDNEPELYGKIDKFMLPGDFIAMKLTGESTTTISGLSEGIFWDFLREEPAGFLFDHFGISVDLIPDIRESLGHHGKLTKTAAEKLGIPKETPVTYRAGDQLNNALSLNVLQPGDIAATGGTSGVVYGVSNQVIFDQYSRVNSFAHVNHQSEQKRIGVLLCINGAGIQHSWMQSISGKKYSYPQMEYQASKTSIGSDGVIILPFGNGVERMLNNQNIGASINSINFNRHQINHLIRGGLEGVAFSFIYGIEIMKEMGMSISRLRVGNDNLFQSDIFSHTISALANCEVEIIDTTGAVGAAKAAGVTVGAFKSLDEAMSGGEVIKTVAETKHLDQYNEAYQRWKNYLLKKLNNNS
ncbi:MAG: carbohydrate kinase [Okeania sp. SIO3I5]|uniref:xylulokinase n=1 Tax=Okeania sp. SIO3I5 TaxID=2607805 RepID=UPI0013B6850D|nr:FGGY family carbohydrate kinase [Okeania sp. SIO3I5]NEQ34813.1 carbohydrate kinase [Okeania sp. SIO3I5]